MKYTEQLKNEINTYIASLNWLQSTNRNEINTILERASQQAQEYYDREIAPFQEQLKLVNVALEDTKQLHENVQKMNGDIVGIGTQGGKVGKRQEEDIGRSYTMLRQCREKVLKDLKAVPALKMQPGEPKEVARLISDVTKIKNGLYKNVNVSYEDLMQYMDQNDKKKMIHFIDLLNNVLIGVAITSDGVLKHHTYPLLTRLVGVATLNTDCIGSAPGLEETYSIVCREEYDKLCSFIQEYQLPYQKLCPDVFVILSIKYLRKYIRQDEESPDFERMAFLLADGSHNCDEKLVFSVGYLTKILNLIQLNPSLDFPALAERLFREIGARLPASFSETYISLLRSFAVSYRETPEQILVTEQRYYWQKKLDQEKEQAEYDREMYREEAARMRRQQERLAREEAARQDAQRQADEWKQKQRADQERRDRERESFRQAQKESTDRSKAMHLCWKCANYGHGCDGGILACGNFRPKK